MIHRLSENRKKYATPLQTCRVICAQVLLGTGLLTPGAAEEIRFNEHIRPILAEHCLDCHGPDANKRQGDLRLDVALPGTIELIAPRTPGKSELLRRVTSSDPDERMPPPKTGKSLSGAQTRLLRQWIQAGAAFEGHWSLAAIAAPTPPEIPGATTDIDRFILQALQQRGLTLSQSITRQQLIRRATFDLTGLPPTWQEVETFVNDDSQQAFEKVIDRLLDSPRYGERWGRHWLDIARYADTHGGSAIGFTRFPFSYTYRDYVIRAFNADVPYNRFLTEQLAADQLELDENDPALAALGFLTVGMQYRNLHDIIDDQIDVVTRGLLGLTVACARCHDHKYDAIPTQDYYSLYATFASSRAPQSLPVIGPPGDPQALQDYQRELARRQEQFEDMAREQSVIMRSRLRMQVGSYLRELAQGTPEQDLSATFLSYRTDDLRPHVLNMWRDYLAGLTEDDAVFGPWLKLVKLQPPGFPDECQQLIASLVKQNGDPQKQPALEKLAANAPRWNPRVLQSISQKQPKSLLDVADAYGELFANVHQQWLQAQSETAREAAADTPVIPDEDPRHREVNSPINRQLRRHLYKPGTPTAMPDEVAMTLLNRPIRDNVRGRKGAIHDLHLKAPGSPPRAMSLREENPVREFHVLKRGSAIDRGQVVQARFLTALSSGKPPSFPDGKRRLGLARAIVAPATPLTRRVIVNWVWQHHFGHGLVRTPDDFGTRGQPPTHPRLLDHLATKLLQDDWSLKKLHRRIMLTAVYQQGSIEHPQARTQDPDNDLLWRMPRRRLDLEAMRDAMLAASAELDSTMGGRPFDLLSNPTVPRRSVYGFVNRDIISSLASTFDAANPNACTARRPETNVPQQTLFALNSNFIQDRAAALAALPQITAAKSDTERVRLLYQRTFARLPEPAELQIALRYVQSESNRSQTKSWQRLAHVLLAANEFVFVD